jgi:hypothetical protein
MHKLSDFVKKLILELNYPHLKVVVVIIMQAAIIVVDRAVGTAIIADKEVVREVASEHGSGRLSRRNSGDEWLAVPAPHDALA